MGPQRYTPCAEFEGYTPDKLVDMCSGCGYFFPACCQCRKLGMSSLCHNAAVVYVDGACANNGSADARAGIGGALGGRVQDSWSMEITDDVDRHGKRTNQRAELLAAIHGLINLKTAHRDTEVNVLLVATDSEYVVKGMTEWYPTWKVSSSSLALICETLTRTYSRVKAGLRLKESLLRTSISFISLQTSQMKRKTPTCRCSSGTSLAP
jgi:ribonuclease HI